MLDLDKSKWGDRVKFGEVIQSVTDRVNDPSEAGVERYVGLEHLDPGVLTVQRWDDPSKVSAQKLLFKPGDVIFGRRRAYQKKVARADFHGICSAHALVLRAMPGKIDPDFLPVFLSSDYFLDRAIGISVGSLSPTVNWRDLKGQEFDLPPIEEQKRIAALLWAVERHARNLAELRAVSATAASQFAEEALENLGWETSVGDVIDKERPLCYGVVQPGVDVEDGVGLVRVLDLESGAPKMGQLKRVSQEVDHQYRRSRIRQGDVLVSVVGTIGRTWTVTSEFEGCNIARALARISPESSKMTPAFLELALNTRRVQDSLLREAFESARKTLNLSALSKVMLPSATLEVQSRIVSDHRYLANAARSVADAGAATLSLRAALLSSIFGDS